MSFLTDITGGTKQSSQSESKSWNEAFPFVKDKFGGFADTAGKSNDALAALLGIGGDPAASEAAFNNYLGSSGYDFALDQGTRAITGSNAAKGLLKSGATLKALNSFGQGLAAQRFDNYLDKLGALTGQGLSAGSLIAQAGQRSEGTSQSKGNSSRGFGGILGAILGG